MKTIQMLNGVPVDELVETMRAIRKDPQIAKFVFRARNDWMSGGAGADQFAFIELISGERDVIADFQDGIDMIRLHGVSGQGQRGRFEALEITASGSSTLITYAGHVIELAGISPGQLSQSDFIFV